MVNFSPLAAEICWRVWGTPADFNRFHVLTALLHGTLVVGVSQTFEVLNRGATYIRQGGHHVGHWPTFLVLLFLPRHIDHHRCCQHSSTISCLSRWVSTFVCNVVDFAAAAKTCLHVSCPSCHQTSSARHCRDNVCYTSILNLRFMCYLIKSSAYLSLFLYHFFGYCEYISVTSMLFELGLPSFNNLMHNSKFSFECSLLRCSNIIVSSMFGK